MKNRALQFESLEHRELMSADLWPRGVGLAADLFVDGGANLSQISLSREATLLGWTRETLLTSSSSKTHSVIGGSSSDLNGALLFPDGQPRVGMIYVNGGSANSHGLALGAKGREAIKDFIRAGGSYSGSCAGAFLIGSYSSVLHFWDGGMGVASWGGTNTVSFAATPDHPIAKYLAANGIPSLIVTGVPEYGGPILSPKYRHPDGTEFVGNITSSSSGQRGTYYILEYQESPVSGKVVVQTGHSEYGRKTSHTTLNAGILNYAYDNAKVTPDIKGAIAGTTTAIVGDGQYHRWVIDVAPGTFELRLASSSPLTTEMFVSAGTVAYDGKAQYSGDTITIANPEPGQWSVSVLGTHAVKNGQSYTVTASAVLGPVWESVPIVPSMNLHQNPVDRFDVNGDGTVSLLDVRVLVDAINANGQGPLPVVSTWPAICADVNGDETMDLLDVLDLLTDDGVIHSYASPIPPARR